MATATVTEINELIVGLKDLAQAGKAGVAVGGFDLAKDAAIVIDLFKKRDELVAAFTGLGNIKVSELDGAAAMEIVMNLVEAGKEVMAA